jgi:rhodanese-related sulfurtransferase
MGSVPEVSVEDLAEKLKTSNRFVLLDVREPSELERARITDDRLELVPMSVLGRNGVAALPARAQAADAEVYILCHHGTRSAQVTAWLAARGWTQVFSIAGGIDEYARKVDRSVGSY